MLNGVSISPLICLEGIYPNAHNYNNDISIILANNAWFGASSAGAKLRQFAQVHAKTYATPILLSANFGQSAIITHHGKSIAVLPHSKDAIITQTIQLNNQQTLYATHPYLGLVAYAIMITIVYLMRKKLNGNTSR